MKKVLSILLVLMMIASLAACAKTEDAASDGAEEAAEATEEAAEEGAEEAEGGKYVVAINNWGQANFFARVGKSSMEDELEKLGCEVVPTVTDEIGGRMDAIENAIQLGVDAIIIEEGDITECESAILEAKDAGIIIGSMDAGTADYVDIYVSSDNTNLGTITAQQLADKIGSGARVIEIINDAGSMIRMRKDAAHEVFDAAGIEVAYSLTYSWPDYDADIVEKVSAILQSEGDNIDGVFASFDGVGISAYKAIKEFGLENDIFICGVDGDPDAYAIMLEDGADCNYICTMAQDPETIARTTVDLVYDLLEGKTLESNVVYIPGILVTPENVSEYAE